MHDYTFVDVMKLLAKDEHCSPAILQTLGRTPAMRARMAQVGFIPPKANDPRRFDRPTRAREVLAKFGVALPKPPMRLPRCLEVGTSRGAKRRVRLDRKALFDLVWSQPVEKLAQTWGFSGRGLAKVCQRLQIPVPSRGFWAKAQTGRLIRRPRLPDVPLGEAEEIVIHVSDGGGRLVG